MRGSFSLGDRYGRNILLLYLFHLFNNIAISIVANFLFLDALFLRMGLPYSSIGTIKGLGFLIPMVLLLPLSVFIQSWNKDREIVAIGYLFRVSLPLLFFFLPSSGLPIPTKTFLATLILIMVHLFPIIANNSIHVLMSTYLPRERMGKHITWINVIWTLPGFLLAIPAARYLDTFNTAPDWQFYRVLMVLMIVTGLVQLLASGLIMALPKRDVEGATATKPLLKDSLAPFLDREFRILLTVILLFSVASSMISSFINPYLIKVAGLQLGLISLIGAGISILSIVILPLWGRLLDTFGGRSSVQLALIGSLLSVGILLAPIPLAIYLFALGLWDGQRGAFGSGMLAANQYLVLSLGAKGQRSVYFAAATALTGVGWFVGSTLAGLLLDILEPSVGLPMAYRTLFGATVILFLVLLFFSRHLPRGGHLAGSTSSLRMFRTFRNVFGRVR